MAFSKGLGSVHSMVTPVAPISRYDCITAPKWRSSCQRCDFNRDHVGDKYARLNAAMGISADGDPADFIRNLNA